MKKVSILTCLALATAALVFSSCGTEKKKVLVAQNATYTYGDSPSSSKTTYEYDENGNLIAKIDRNSGDSYSSVSKVTYKYDDESRLISTTYYYDGEATVRERNFYNENGDTLCVMSESCYENNEWKVDSKLSNVYEGGKKTDAYEFHRWTCEEEGCDFNYQISHRVYTDGKLVKEIGYNNNNWESGADGSIEIKSGNSSNPAKEFKEIIENYSLQDEMSTTYTYNEDGKLLSEKSSGEYGCKTTYTYDSKGLLTKKSMQWAFDDEPSVTKFTYDDAGRLTAESCVVNEYYSSKTTYKYNENGDTIEVVTIGTSEEGDNVETRIRYTYEETEEGVLKTKYVLGVADEWGHDDQSFRVYKYDAEGYIVEERYYAPSDYVEDFKIDGSFSGSPEAELNYYKSHYNFTQNTLLTYEYEVTEEQTGPFAGVVKFIKGLFGSSDNDDDKVKGRSGVEYETA